MLCLKNNNINTKKIAIQIYVQSGLGTKLFMRITEVAADNTYIDF